jgi:putative transcription factor
MPKKSIPLPPVKQRPRKHKGDDVEKYQVDPDYAEIIRNGRERLAITQDELAMKILERRNVIASIERGVLMPEIKVARKLEKLLGVKILIEDE